MSFARILAGVVVEIFTPPEGTDLAACFHPDVAAEFVTAPAGVVAGWGYDGSAFTPPPPAPAVDLAAYAAAKRYAVETGGITLNGAEIATDAASQSKIGNAYLLLQASGAASVEFKAQNGFATLSADQFKALALAVGGHVQACYAREAEVDAGITAGTIKTTADVDAAFASLTA